MESIQHPVTKEMLLNLIKTRSYACRRGLLKILQFINFLIDLFLAQAVAHQNPQLLQQQQTRKRPHDQTLMPPPQKPIRKNNM